MQDYVIETGQGKKGRSFRATAIALATADGLWESGGSTIRPVYAQFAGTDAELKSFVANLKAGRKAEKSSHRSKGSDKERLEFLKTVKYNIAWQREAEGTIVTVYHPELFLLDPGMIDPEGIRFCLFVPTDWAEAQQLDRQGPVQHLARLPQEFFLQHQRESREKMLTTEYLGGLVPTAYLFGVYLDRRTHCPLVADGRFYLQLLVAALDQGSRRFPEPTSSTIAATTAGGAIRRGAASIWSTASGTRRTRSRPLASGTRSPSALATRCSMRSWPSR
jgi:hypothetical protein